MSQQVAERVEHPAKFSEEIFKAIEIQVVTFAYSHFPCRVLDPFAGVGGIHELQDCGLIPGLETVGLEIEPEWAGQHPRTIVGNVLAPPFALHTFDVIATSPCYGNRMSDHHNARDASKRITYKHKLGRDPHAESSATMHWGDDYRAFHRSAWARVIPLLKRGGIFVLNVSDHLKTERKGDKPMPQYVTDFHVQTLGFYGLRVIGWDRIATKRMGFGANSKTRVDHESVITFKWPL